MAEKDQLVAQSETQVDPYRVKAGEFSVGSVQAKTGQSGAHGTAEGQDQLVSQSDNQLGVRHNEDGGRGSSGAGSPAEWGKGGKSFSAGTGAEAGTSVSISESVNLQTGHIEVKGEGQTRVKEVPESKVSIG